jgi:hypothetical protein
VTGLDAWIYFESEVEEPKVQADSKVVWDVELLSALPQPGQSPDSATHWVNIGSRYYGKDYERGHWPELCEVLMLLFSSPDIKRVWYGNEYGVYDVTPEFVADLCLHFMKKKGNRWCRDSVMPVKRGYGD